MTKILVSNNLLEFGQESPVKWKHLKDFEFQDEDTIIVQYQERDDEYYVCVSRMMEETDEQYEERMEAALTLSAQLQARRYQQYLKLKKEFEDFENI
jgi:predicted transcriptional regulator